MRRSSLQREWFANEKVNLYSTPMLSFVAKNINKAKNKQPLVDPVDWIRVNRLEYNFYPLKMKKMSKGWRDTTFKVILEIHLSRVSDAQVDLFAFSPMVKRIVSIENKSRMLISFYYKKRIFILDSIRYTDWNIFSWVKIVEQGQRAAFDCCKVHETIRTSYTERDIKGWQTWEGCCCWSGIFQLFRGLVLLAATAFLHSVWSKEPAWLVV